MHSTGEEVRVIEVEGVKYYDKYCKCGCGQRIKVRPHHKWCGIPDYISGHNVTHGEWSEKETKILRENYPTLAIKELRRLLPNKSEYAIYGKARELGLRKTKVIKTSGVAWSEYEIQTLKELYPKIGIKVSKKLRGRTKQSIITKANSLGIKVNRDQPRVLESLRKHPNLSPSPALAYIIGVLLGDGWTNKIKVKWGYYNRVGLGVVEQAFANAFADALRKIGLNPTICLIRRAKKYSNRRDYYKVTAVSVEFYEWWNKIKDNYEYLAELIKSYEIDFIRGFYESEGSLYLDNKNGYRHKISIHNTNEELIDFVLKLLVKLGFHFRKYKSENRGKNRKTLYILLLQRKAEIRRFLTLINPIIKNGGDQVGV